jgi:hypothetical protein
MFSVVWTSKSFSLTAPAKPGNRIAAMSSKIIVFRFMVIPSFMFDGFKSVDSVLSEKRFPWCLSRTSHDAFFPFRKACFTFHT